MVPFIHSGKCNVQKAWFSWCVWCYINVHKSYWAKQFPRTFKCLFISRWQSISKTVTSFWVLVFFLKQTGGSTILVHLIMYASQVLRWLLEVSKVLAAKETFFSKYIYFGGFLLFEEGRVSFTSFFLAISSQNNDVLVLVICWKGNFLNFQKLILFFNIFLALQ